AVVGGDEVGLAVLGVVVQQRAGADPGAAVDEAVVRHAADLVPVGVAEGADHVDVAGARGAGTGAQRHEAAFAAEHVAVARAHIADADLVFVPWIGKAQGDHGLVTGHGGDPDVAVLVDVTGAVGPRGVLLVEAVDVDLGVLGNIQAGQAQVQFGGVGCRHAHPPDPGSVPQGFPEAVMAAVHGHIVADGDPHALVAGLTAVRRIVGLVLGQQCLAVDRWHAQYG